jgi:hypothetical protein
MVSIGFPFNDLYFIVNPFQFSGMDGIVTVIQNAITMAVQHFAKVVQDLDV